MSAEVRERMTSTDDPTGRQVAAASNPLVAEHNGRDSRPLAIKTENVSRIYKIRGQKNKNGEIEKALTALSSVNLEVYQGELFGLLGPNGAGKTTLIKILTTLLAPSGGICYVDGLDVVKQSDEVRRRINMVSGGETSGFGILTVRENLWMFSQFYGVSNKDAQARISEMLKIVELEDKANARVSGLSTGQRQRMNFCRGFINEPTLGLDVNAARIVRDFTRDWMKRNSDRTVLLTTHYMAEADELCDRIAIIDHGTVLACDTPTNLKRLLQKQPVFEINAGGLNDRSLDALAHSPGVVRMTSEAAEGGSAYNLKFILEEEAAIGGVVSTLAAHNGNIISLQKNEPTLEDVFIKLVGRSLSAEDHE